MKYQNALFHYLEPIYIIQVNPRYLIMVTLGLGKLSPKIRKQIIIKLIKVYPTHILNTNTIKASDDFKTVSDYFKVINNQSKTVSVYWNRPIEKVSS